MLRVFLDADPWALPTTIALTLAALLLAPRCARRFGGRAFGWWFFLSSVGVFAAVTMTPAGGDFTAGFSGHVIRSMAPTLPGMRDLRSLDEVSLNVLVGVPVGAAIALLAHQLRRWWPLLFVGLPLVSELVQGALPGLNRVGFLLGDAITNLLGIALGTGACAAVLLARAVRPGTGAIRRG
ncbi:hypothetical protein [Marmoricola sp. RAF53]|uniref:hypothetical protein n=1 Tax=Marmoricola sp. RAF53 TaxID=3233059 RepID=UPI003F979DD0